MKSTLRLILWPVCLLLGVNALADSQNITLPIGTEIAVRTIDRIDSKKVSKEYAATLDDPILVDGVTVVPANANAFLRVVDKSRAFLSISLIAVTINGQRVEVNTDKVDSRRGSTTKRTAVGAGVGAGTGAAIGAIAGGGAGAGIGAAVGAATGGIFGHMTAKPIEIAPETRFTYRLTQAVAINSQPAAAPAGPATEPPPQSSAALPPIPPPPAPREEPRASSQVAINNGSDPELIGAVYFRDQAGILTPLERNRGRGAQQNLWGIEASRSPVRLKSGQKMLFVVQLANGIDPGTFTLFPLETKKDRRLTISDPRDRNAPLTLIFNVTKAGESSYGLTPVNDLTPGEYAFTPSNSSDVYCFGVD